MSYQSKLRADLRDIRALISDPIGRARALGQKGTDAELSAIAKQMIKAFAEHAENVADLAMDESRNDGFRSGVDSRSHLVPPSGTLEDKILAITRQGCIVTASLTPQMVWRVLIDAGGQTRFAGFDKDPDAALKQAEDRMNTFEETRGRGELRQA